MIKSLHEFSIKYIFSRFKHLWMWEEIGERFAQELLYSNEAALPLRSRRSGTKFVAPNRTAY